MKRLDGYIGRTVITHTVVVGIVLLGLYFFSSVVREMGHVGKGNYSTADALAFSLMLLPRQLYELFPLLALLGSMLGLGALASSSELTVMRSAGISIRRMTLSVLKAGLLMIVVVTAIGEGVAPTLEQMATNQRLTALLRGVNFSGSSDALWAKDGDSYVSVPTLDVTGNAQNVTFYRIEDLRLVEITNASQARLNGGKWELSQVTRTRFDDEGVQLEKFDALAWPSRLAPEVINLASMKPQNLSVIELNELIGYMQKNELASQRYEVAMWIRIFTPIATGGMLLLALPFVFGSMRSMAVGARVMMGAMIGIVFYLVNNVFSRMGLLYDIPPLLSAATPTILVFIAWYLMMRRVR